MTRTRRVVFLAVLAFASVACASFASGTKSDSKADETQRERASERRRARIAKKADATATPPADTPAGEGTAPLASVESPPADAAPAEEGLASFYADMLSGNRTASGERYRPSERTCAHRTHKFGTRVVVTALDTGQKTTCRINDRGPFVSGRVIDLSKKSAEDLQMLKLGVIRVRVEVAADGSDS